MEVDVCLLDQCRRWYCHYIAKAAYPGIGKGGGALCEASPADLADPLLVEWHKSPSNPMMRRMVPRASETAHRFTTDPKILEMAVVECSCPPTSIAVVATRRSF